MRTYGVPVNADLVDILDPDVTEWQDMANIMHTFLSIEYVARESGCMCTNVRGRAVVRFTDFLD
jgi:hypothetical protein